MYPRANLHVVPVPRATSSLVLRFDVTVHIVLDDYGKAGRVYRETDEEDTTVGSVVDDLLSGQFNNPVRVVAFNTLGPGTTFLTRPKDGHGTCQRT
jgi:hypothetical protein